jgi:agmatine deiminase
VHSIPRRTISGTLDVWCRDYMPVPVAEDRFVQFRYAPDYLTGEHQHLLADGEIGPRLPWVKNCERSGIVLDGGNVVGWGDRAIVTDKVFRENPGLSREAVADA